MGKRKLLTVLLAVVALSGLLIFVMPFLQSMSPTSEAVNNATQNVSIEDIKAGTYKMVQWQGRPVVVYRPSKESISELEAMNTEVWGPDITEDNHETLYVYEPISTYLGCSLVDIANRSESEYWPDGWLDPCHVGLWDYAGRTFRVHNATRGLKLENLKSVKYKYIKNDVIQLHP